MKLSTSFLFWIVFALVVGATGCVLEDFPETSSAATDEDAGSSDGSDASCDPTTCNDSAGPGANGICVDGTCKYQCESVFDDTDDNISNGCEIDRSSVATCGPRYDECTPNSLNHLPVCEKDDSGKYGCGHDSTQCADGYAMDEDEGCVSPE